MKNCSKCKKITNDFGVKKRRKNGVIISYHSYCKICYEITEKRSLKRRQNEYHDIIYDLSYLFDQFEKEFNKKCSNCKVIKNVSEFHKTGRFGKNGKEYVRSQCKICRLIKKEPVIITTNEVKGKKCKNCNESKELDKFYTRMKNNKILYEARCKDCINSARRKETTKSYDRKYGKKYCQQCQKWNEVEEYCKDNDKKDNLSTLCKECKNSNLRQYNQDVKKDEEKYKIIQEKVNKYKRERRNNDEDYKILCNLRSRLRHALNGKTKSDRTLKLLGCSTEDLWNHLENLFIPGMTRENYGEVWHLDHLKPCSIFNLEDPLEQRKCFNWKNLQPLFAIENLQKSNSYTFDVNHEILLHFIK